MTLCCIAYNCTSKKREKGVGFHRFPHNDPKLLKLWIAKLKWKDWTPGLNTLICSKHFEGKYLNLTGWRPRLRPGAVPTIFDFPEAVAPRKALINPSSKRATTDSRLLQSLDFAPKKRYVPRKIKHVVPAQPQDQGQQQQLQLQPGCLQLQQLQTGSLQLHDPRAGSSQQHLQTGSSQQQQPQAGSSQQHLQAGSLQQHPQAGSSQQQLQAGSSQQHLQAGSSQHLQAGSSQQHLQAGSSQQQLQAGSLQQQQPQAGASQQQLQAGSSQQHLQAGSSQQQLQAESLQQQQPQAGSSQQHLQAGSSQQHLQAGSSQQQLQAGSLQQQQPQSQPKPPPRKHQKKKNVKQEKSVVSEKKQPPAPEPVLISWTILGDGGMFKKRTLPSFFHSHYCIPQSFHWSGDAEANFEPLLTEKSEVSTVPHIIKITGRWQWLGLDFRGPLPQTINGDQFLLTVTDYHSKWVEAFPVANMVSPETAGILCDLFAQFGYPLGVLSRLRNYSICNLNKIVRRQFNRRGMPYESHLIVYHRQTAYLDPVTEFRINSMLSELVRDHPNTWNVHLPGCVLRLCCTEHPDTGTSPFARMYLREPKPVTTPRNLPFSPAIIEDSSFVIELSDKPDQNQEQSAASQMTDTGVSKDVAGEGTLNGEATSNGDYMECAQMKKSTRDER